MRLENVFGGTFTPEGVFSGLGNEARELMEVTAQNACGQVTTSFFLGSF
jgi:hypothetical protein